MEAMMMGMKMRTIIGRVNVIERKDWNTVRRCWNYR